MKNPSEQSTTALASRSRGAETRRRNVDQNKPLGLIKTVEELKKIE